MKMSCRCEFEDSPTLGDLAEAVTAMVKAGAPVSADILLTMGDLGSQRDPWPYVRAFTATWEAS